jgi:hypothetical protein
VSPYTLVRAAVPDGLVGPYISQFLLRDVQYGTLQVSQRQDTVRLDVNYMIDFNEWLAVQRGAPRSLRPEDRDLVNTRYIQTPRDLTHTLISTPQTSGS